MAAKSKIILDVDPGVDDAEAIIMALSQPSSADVIAITCVSGNVSLDQALVNTLRTLEVCGRLDVPVYSGCTQPLVTEAERDNYFGDDGLGEAGWNSTPDLSVIKEEHAVQAMIRLVNENEGEVTVVSLGPVTNLAAALQFDPDLGKKLKRCVIMGGNLHGKGNVTRSAEFNFYHDPESARLVLLRLDCHITLLTWEVVFERIVYDWEFFDKIVSINSKKAEFVKAITARQVNRKGPFFICDPAAVAFALDESVIRKSKHLFCDVELGGELTRGQMVVDWSKKKAKEHPPNVHLVTRVHLDKLQKMVEDMML